MNPPDPNTALSMKQSKFSDYVNGAMLIAISTVLCIVNLYEFLLTTRSFRKLGNVILVTALLATLQNNAIKVYEYSVYYPGGEFPVWVDSWKSFMGQICNPLACYCMSIRAHALVRGNRLLTTVVLFLAYSVLASGLVASIFREVLTYMYYGQEDKVLGGARTTVGAFTNLYSTICQILFTGLFFWQIKVNLLAETPQEKKEKQYVMIGAFVQSMIILGCTIYYSIARPLGYKTASSLLPLISSMSCRFMIQFSILFSSRSNFPATTTNVSGAQHSSNETIATGKILF
jgi:hypothetical protein